jgi:phage FluMu gp28-like protein
VINSLAASAGVRGGKKDMVFDEFAHIMFGEDLFYAAAPAIINDSGSLDIVSTPLGNQNLFAKIWLNETQPDGSKPFDLFSRHQFAWWDVRRFVVDYDAAQYAWKNDYHQDLNAIHTFMPEMVDRFGTPRLKFFYHLYPLKHFLQEFCCSLNDDANAFFPWELIKKCLRGSLPQADDEVDPEAVVPWVNLSNEPERPEDSDTQAYMGVDFGESDKHTDKTSIQVLELLPGGRMLHRYSEVLDKRDYPDFPSQAAHIADVGNRLRVTKLFADATGLGRGTVPMVRQNSPNFSIEEVNFNVQSKEKMVMNIKGLMEHNKLWLQAEDRQLHAQINGVQREILPSGQNRYSGEPHDDMFWALALAAQGGQHTPFTIWSLGGTVTLGR